MWQIRDFTLFTLLFLNSFFSPPASDKKRLEHDDMKSKISQ